MNRVVLDCRNLLCPMPVIRVQNRVAEMAPGGSAPKRGGATSCCCGLLGKTDDG